MRPSVQLIVSESAAMSNALLRGMPPGFA